MNLHLIVPTDVRASLLPRAKSTIHSQPGIGQYYNKEIGVRRAVKTEEPETAGEESKKGTSTETTED